MIKSATVIDSVGTITRPMTTEQLIAKGAGLAELGLPDSERIAALLWDEKSGAHRLSAPLTPRNSASGESSNRRRT